MTIELQNEQLCLSSFHLTQNLHYYERGKFLFINNAKAGCSTVKSSLLHAIAELEGQESPEILSAGAVHGDNAAWSKKYNHLAERDIFTFSVVRNPYTRVLSAYLDKVVRKGILRSQFMFMAGLPDDTDLSFVEFLRILASTPHIFDQHWRPQVANLLVGHLRIDDVRYLENFSQTGGDLAAKIGIGLSFTDRISHGTSAKEKAKGYLTEEAVSLIQRIYIEDFETFGYSLDPARVAEAPGEMLQFEAKNSATLTTLSVWSYRRMKQNRTVHDIIRSKCPKKLWGSSNVLTIAEKAQICKMPLAKLFLDRADLTIEAQKLAQTGTVAEQFLATSILIDLGALPDSNIDCTPLMQDRVKMAPYIILNHVQLVKQLIQTNALNEANSHIAQLAKMTWRPNLVDDLRALAASS